MLKKFQINLKRKNLKLSRSQKKTRPKKPPGRKKIDLRGKAKTNPSNAPATRAIAAKSLEKKLKGTGKVKTKAMKETIDEVRSEARKRGISNPSRGLVFKAMYDAGLKPVRRGGRMVLDEFGRPVTRKPPGRKKRGR